MTPLVGASKLSIYLNDHLAGATVGVEVARRAARNNEGGPYGPSLAELASEIAADRKALLMVMQQLSIGADTLKVAISWLSEKATRLKLNGELLHYSDLSRLEELELLALGVRGKLAMWDALVLTHAEDPRLEETDLEAARSRARSQLRRLERMRQRSVVEALQASE